MDKLILKVNKTIEKYQMINQGDRIIIAVSGGPDSICLLDILNQIKKKYRLSLIVANVNHGIRERESKIESRFLRLKSYHLGLPFESIEASIPELARGTHLSIETAGRKIRYHFFDQLVEKYQAQKVALGHHADDQIETVLMRMIRGSGLQGLKGIPAKRDHFIRPLIECRREEIELYCQRRGLSYSIDRTNQDFSCFRNRIRNQLIPLLKKDYNSATDFHILQLQEIVQDELKLLDEITLQSYKKIVFKENFNRVILLLDRLKDYPVALQRRLLRKSLCVLRKNLPNIHFDHIESIRSLYRTESGEKHLNLPGGLMVKKDYKNLEITCKKVGQKHIIEKSFNQWEYLLPVCSKEEFPLLGFSISTERLDEKENEFLQLKKNLNRFEVWVDYDKLVFPLGIRNRREGDQFIPLNCPYFKKLKTYFIDRKINRSERGNVPIVTDGLGRIVWIVGFQLDDRFKIEKETRRVLHIRKSRYELKNKD